MSGVIGLTGKVVAITGASSGIGEATARLLAAGGAHVVIGARRLDRLERLAGEITAASRSVLATALDVTQRKDVERFVGAAQQAFGQLDVMVNNAGVMPLSLLASLKVDEWDRMVDVNIKGVLYGIAAALPVMQARGSGQIVSLSSIGAHRDADGGGLLRDQIRGARDLGRVAPGNRSDPGHRDLAGRDHLRTGGIHLRSRSPRGDARLPLHRHQRGRRRTGYRLRDQLTRRGGRERDHRAAHCEPALTTRQD